MSHEIIEITSTEADEQYDFHCITCSDEALPAKVLSVNEATGMARVQVGGAEEEVDISLVDAVVPGDTVLVHGGVALGIVDD